jgi:hypothetical protein
MKPFFEWYRSQPAQQPWLILGKGPSFEKRRDYDLGEFRTMALNHVVRELAVDVAHAIDVEVITACADALERNCRVLAMPWIPHVGNALGQRTLEDWVREIPVLQRLAAAGRLTWYDLSTSRQRHGKGPVVQARYFSAEAALSLLALAGAATVRSLGVDGGTGYSASFKDLNDTTRLSNRHASFNIQFAGFARTLRTTGVDYAPLDLQSPIQVFVGSEEPQMLAVKVLEYSIRCHTSMSVRVTPLHEAGVRTPLPKDAKNRPRTPFSFLRFAIPQLCGHRGRAVYLDSDMLVFKDLRELWTQDMGGADLLAAREPGASGRRPQFSVMLLDCGRLPWSVERAVGELDSGALTYEQLMYEMRLARDVRAGIDPAWNSLESYQAGETALIHYTDMTRQPWVHRRNRWGHLWVKALREAIDDGFIARDEVVDHVARGWVRPSLLWQLETRRDRVPLWAVQAVRADRDFVPPCKALSG